MSTIYKILTALVLLSGSFIAGYYTRKPTTTVETKIETKEVEKIITRRVTDRETKPDGTVKETVTENVTGVTTSRSNERKDEQTIIPQPQYQIGVMWGLSRDMDWVPEQVQVGRRIVGPVWGTAGYGIKHNELLIGVQVEF